MSSDFLNYELSKELHDLGVVFGNPLAYYRGTELHHGNRCDYYYFMPCETDIPAPSTAQLIDEIAKRQQPNDGVQLLITSTWFRFWHESYGDPCATTALGKALIALVKEDRK